MVIETTGVGEQKYPYSLRLCLGARVGEGIMERAGEYCFRAGGRETITKGAKMTGMGLERKGWEREFHVGEGGDNHASVVGGGGETNSSIRYSLV